MISPNTHNTHQALSQWRSNIDARLSQLLARQPEEPEGLNTAMRYSTLNGGKRIRPLLAIAAHMACTGEIADPIIDAACAIEMIHSYSLVHDDLPCMDDDDIRRGQATCHKVYGEAEALLVGDALQSQAFQILSQPHWLPNAAQQLRLIHLIASASGPAGMVGGQSIDLSSIGLTLSQKQLETMHRLKTGALIRAAVLAGAYIGNADTEQEHALDIYSQRIGLAFQVVDDILDVQGDIHTLGKTMGKDAAQDKPTFVSLMGLTNATHYAQSLIEEALASIGKFDHHARYLRDLAKLIVARTY